MSDIRDIIDNPQYADLITFDADVKEQLTILEIDLSHSDGYGKNISNIMQTATKDKLTIQEAFTSRLYGVYFCDTAEATGFQNDSFPYTIIIASLNGIKYEPGIAAVGLTEEEAISMNKVYYSMSSHSLFGEYGTATALTEAKDITETDIDNINDIIGRINLLVFGNVDNVDDDFLGRLIMIEGEAKKAPFYAIQFPFINKQINPLTRVRLHSDERDLEVHKTKVDSTLEQVGAMSIIEMRNLVAEFYEYKWTPHLGNIYALVDRVVTKLEKNIEQPLYTTEGVRGYVFAPQVVREVIRELMAAPVSRRGDISLKMFEDNYNLEYSQILRLIDQLQIKVVSLRNPITGHISMHAKTTDIEKIKDKIEAKQKLEEEAAKLNIITADIADTIQPIDYSKTYLSLDEAGKLLIKALAGRENAYIPENLSGSQVARILEQLLEGGDKVEAIRTQFPGFATHIAHGLSAVNNNPLRVVSLDFVLNGLVHAPGFNFAPNNLTNLENYYETNREAIGVTFGVFQKRVSQSEIKPRFYRTLNGKVGQFFDPEVLAKQFLGEQ